MCMFFQKGLSVLSKRCVCSTAHVFMWLLVSMMFLSVFVMFLSSFCVLSFRTIVCYLLGRLIYAAFVSQQYLGLCPFWLLCINSNPSYGYCLPNKNNIHPQSKGMGRSSAFIINVANHGKMWATQQEWTSLPRPATRSAVAAAEEQRAVLIEPVSSTGCILFEVCLQIFRCAKQN